MKNNEARAHLIDEKFRCLLDVDILLRRCFEPAREVLLFAVFVHLGGRVNQAFFLLVALVRQQDTRYRWSVRKLNFRIQVLFPFHHRVQRRASRDVEDYEGTYGFFVVNSGHVSESLLTCVAKINKIVFCNQHRMLSSALLKNIHAICIIIRVCCLSD